MLFEPSNFLISTDRMMSNISCMEAGFKKKRFTDLYVPEVVIKFRQYFQPHWHNIH